MIASESTFYCVLKSANQLTKRPRECQYKRPDVLKTVAPNQVWIGTSAICRLGSEAGIFTICEQHSERWGKHLGN